MPHYKEEVETNADSVKTTSTGAGSVTVTKLSQVSFAQLESSGYHFHYISSSGQVIQFQAQQVGGTQSPFANPSAAVSFAAGSINIREIGE